MTSEKNMSIERIKERNQRGCGSMQQKNDIAYLLELLGSRDRAHAEELKKLESELAEAKQEIKKSHHSLTVTADDNSRLRAALVLIRDEARENKTQGGAVARATVGIIQIIAEKALTPDNAKRERRL